MSRDKYISIDQMSLISLMELEQLTINEFLIWLKTKPDNLQLGLMRLLLLKKIQ